ncbi:MULTISPECIES: trypco2 family protein [unclassified Streptomyces]|uniref:trypco2 family protein n=1 Tax=unclassified Streptomyces TaxID=2593676 RepID=UPI0036F8BEF8
MRELQPIGLAEAIGAVRAELAQAQAEGAHSDWRFTVEQVSLEFSVQFHRSGEGGAGLRLGVVEARLGGSVSHDATHRIEVALKPLPRADGTHHEVSRETPAVPPRPQPHDGSLARGE